MDGWTGGRAGGWVEGCDFHSGGDNMQDWQEWNQLVPSLLPGIMPGKVVPAELYVTTPHTVF